MVTCVCFEENGEVTRYDFSGFDGRGTDIKGEAYGEGRQKADTIPSSQVRRQVVGISKAQKFTFCKPYDVFAVSHNR